MASIISQGLNYAIDFKGGAIVELESMEPIQATTLQTSFATLGFGDVSVSRPASTNRAIVVLTGRDWTREMLSEAETLVRRDFPAVRIVRTELIATKVAGELVATSLFAIGFVVFGCFVWTWFRVGRPFAIALGMTQMFEVVTMAGFFALTQLALQLAAMSFLLLLLVLSLVQKLIVFRGIGRNLHGPEATSYEWAVDQGVSQTFMRVLVITLAVASVTAIVSGVSSAALFGISICTLSTIFVAPSLMLGLIPTRQAALAKR